jgi:hypothetical protein
VKVPPVAVTAISLWETVIVVELPEPPPPSDASSPPQATSMVAINNIAMHKTICALFFIAYLLIVKKGSESILDPLPIT